MPVSVTENATTSAGPPPRAARPARSCSATLPCWVNFTALDSRLCSTWRSRCRSVTSSAGTSGTVATAKSQLASRRPAARTRSAGPRRAREREPLRVDSSLPASTRDRSRMSLISSSRSDPDEWITLAYSTCLGGQVLGRVLGQQPGQDQQAVQRGAQLVRDVGQELGLVPGGQVQLPGPLLDLLPGLLDLDVLDLDVPLLPGQLGGLVLQLGVGALQFLLPGLQLPGAGLELPGQPLRLLQQVVGARVRR